MLTILCCVPNPLSIFLVFSYTYKCSKAIANVSYTCSKVFYLLIIQSNHISLSNLDINECLERTDNCEQFCDNLDGSFTCRCYSFFVLADNNRCSGGTSHSNILRDNLHSFMYSDMCYSLILSSCFNS